MEHYKIFLFDRWYYEIKNYHYYVIYPLGKEKHTAVVNHFSIKINAGKRAKQVFVNTIKFHSQIEGVHGGSTSRLGTQFEQDFPKQKLFNILIQIFTLVASNIARFFVLRKETLMHPSQIRDFATTRS